MVNFLKSAMSTPIPSGPVFVEKDGRRAKCISFVQLRDRLQCGWKQVTDEGEEAIEFPPEEEKYNIETEDELKAMDRADLKAWALGYGLELYPSISSQKLLEACLDVRKRKIEQGVV